MLIIPERSKTGLQCQTMNQQLGKGEAKVKKGFETPEKKQQVTQHTVFKGWWIYVCMSKGEKRGSSNGPQETKT